MYKQFFILIIIVLAENTSKAQLVLTSPNSDTAVKGQVTMEGYVDTYFGFDFNQPKTSDRPYFVSQSRSNEVNINLAYLSLKYTSDRVRVTFTPGFGTYMNANYAAEKITLKNIVEANVGFRPFADKKIWLDIGVLPSPYTNESAVSFDQSVYSRTFAAENVPYYLAGARLSLPVTNKLTANLYLLNGWQAISDVNNPLSFGSNIEYKATENLTLNWDTYAGYEESDLHTDFKTRYYTDLYAVWSPTPKIVWTACVYGGIQEREVNKTIRKDKWWQSNTSFKYAFSTQHSLAARVEYFNDPQEVMIQPITGISGFNSFSESLCYNWNVSKQMMFRLEARYFNSTKNVYLSASNNPIKTDFLVLCGLSAKF